MCGIAGMMAFDPEVRADAGLVEVLCNELRHRGPNDQGIHVSGPVGIGMRRLSIIDIATGHQPISNEDGTIWIVFNGEIFNFESLREQLTQAGHRFQTKSDTETILHLYEDEGFDCVHKLRGMFAFAIWDSRKHLLFLARDRLGIKPLFLRTTDDGIYFASEIKALLKTPGFDRCPDWTAIDAYLTYGYIPFPLTAFAGITKVPPGHQVIVTDKGARIEKFWDLPFLPKHSGSTEELLREVESLLLDSVRMRLVSEVPLGAFLSGGVDSGLIVGMMSRFSGRATRTFTIGFGGNTGNFLDERRYARMVHERYHTEHEEFEVTPDFEEALDVAVRAFDEPFADDSVIPTHYICKLARKKVTVALTGLGGDENFAGYERHLGFRLSSLYDRLPQWFRSGLVHPLVSRLPEESGGHYRINHLKRFVSASGLSPSRRYQSYITIFNAEERARLLARPWTVAADPEFSDRAGRRHFEEAIADDDCDRALYQDTKMYLPEDILALTDRISMHHSLELRVPFTDHRLMEFCARLPLRAKLRLGKKKVFLRKLGQKYLPPEVLSHRKQGFASPLAVWFRGDLRPFLESRLSAAVLDKAGILVGTEVRRLLDEHWERRALNDKKIFTILVLAEWFQRFFNT